MKGSFLLLASNPIEFMQLGESYCRTRLTYMRNALCVVWLLPVWRGNFDGPGIILSKSIWLRSFRYCILVSWQPHSTMGPVALMFLIQPFRSTSQEFLHPIYRTILPTSIIDLPRPWFPENATYYYLRKYSLGSKITGSQLKTAENWVSLRLFAQWLLLGSFSSNLKKRLNTIDECHDVLCPSQRSFMAARSRKDISKGFPGLEMNPLEAIRMMLIGKPHPFKSIFFLFGHSIH